MHNAALITQTNTVKSLSDGMVFSLSGSKCTVPARILHGHTGCTGGFSLQNLTQDAQTIRSKIAVVRIKKTM